MDPNLQSIILGLLTNGLTAFIAQFARKDSKLLLGEELLKNIKWEETALQPLLQRAAQSVAENIEWQGTPSLEIVCLFLTSPEAETIVRQMFATQFAGDVRVDDLVSIRRTFLNALYLYTTSYSSFADLKENQLIDTSNVLFDTLLEGCEQTFNSAIDKGNLSAHEAKSAFRHRLLLEELTAVHEKVAFLSSQQKPNVRAILAFEETYRRLIGNRHKYLTPPNFGKVRRLPINKLYVSPNFVISRNDDEEHMKQLELFPSQDSLAIPYNEVLSGAFRIVLLGNPGGGKSTFAQKLCFDLTMHYSERIYGGRKNITPIMVILRDYGSEKKSQGCSILEFIQTRAKIDYQLQSPPGAFEYLLLNGRVMVVFDGLDELLDTRDRQEITKAVEAFCTLYASVPILVTSREVGYEQAPLDEEMFEIFRLSGFSEAQVQEYVKKWFDINTDITNEQRKQKTQAFLEESELVPDLRTNPLMLALLCNIYQEENYIPTNRPDVYEKCANMLFERWDRSRGINISLSFEVHLRPTMTYLAYWIYSDEKQGGGVIEKRLVSKTAEYLHEKLLEDEAQKVAKEFIEFCKGRAWVFTNIGSTKYGEELYQFTHQTFLEYFTALYLCRTNPTPARLLNILRSKIAKREWDVIAQLAFQKQNRDLEGAGNYLLSALIKQVRTSSNEMWNLLSFTVRCLEFMIPSPSIIQDIVSTCIIQSFSWGNTPRNISSKKSKLESSTLQNIFKYLLNAAPENRRIIADQLEKQLIKYAKGDNEFEAYMALEIAINLNPLATMELRGKDAALRSRTDPIWGKVSNFILESCTEQLKVLCRKYSPLCVKLRGRDGISMVDIIKWHGVECIFKNSKFVEVDIIWVSSVCNLLNSCSGTNDNLIDQDYSMNELKQIGSMILNIEPPWIKDSDIGTYGLMDYIEYQPTKTKNTQIKLNCDADTLFGFFILFSVMIDSSFKKGTAYHWLSERGRKSERQSQSIEITQAINQSKHPIFNFIRGLLIARYEAPVSASSHINTASDKIQLEMNKCNFSSEQQNFIWRWIRREFEIIQDPPND